MEFRPDFYEILQVDRRASQEIITVAYQNLSAKNGPENSENEMKLIREAYQVLGDPQNRWQYDAWLSNNVPISRQYENSSPPITNRTEYKVSPVRTLSVIDAYRFGFEMFIKQPALTLLLIMLSLLVGWLSLPITNSYLQMPNSLFTFFVSILGAVLLAIIVKLIFNVFDNKEIKVNHLISIRMIVYLIVYYILSGLIITLGFIFLIIPGIIFSLKLAPGFLLIIDEDLGPIDALKKSWKITKGFKGKIFLSGLVYGLIVSILMIPFLQFFKGNSGFYFATIFVGFILAPVFYYSAAFFYRTLLNQTQAYEFGDMEVNAFQYEFIKLNNISLAIAVVMIIGLLALYAHFSDSVFENFQQENFNNYMHNYTQASAGDLS